MISAGTAFAADDAAVGVADNETDAGPVISDIDVASDELDSSETDELILNDTDDVLSAANAKNTQFTAANNFVYDRSIVDEGLGLYPIVLTTSGGIIPLPLANKTVSIDFNDVKKDYTTNSVGLVDYYIPADTPSGTYKLNMKFAGDGSYSGSQRTTTIKIVDVSTQIIAPENSAYPTPLVASGMAYYPIALTSNTTVPVPLGNKVIRVNFNGVEKKFTTNEYGIFNYTLDSGLASGVYPVEITYDGEDGYKPAKFTTKVKVYDVPTKIIALKNASYPTSLVVKNLAYYPIELTTDISINVTDSTIPIPVPLANKIVKVRFNGGDYSKHTTDEYGFFNYTLDSGLAPGVYPIEVSYDGGKGYLGSHFNATVEVYDASTQIIAADNVSYPHPLVAGGNGYYPITLTTTDIPIPIANKTVNVKFNGESKKLITDSYGIINYVIPDVSAGNYTINMVFDGDEKFTGSSLTAHVGIYDVGTKFTVTKNMTYESSKVREATAFYPILLTTDTAVPVPLANKTVSIKFNGVVSQHTTNELGIINYVIPVGTPAGKFTLNIVFEGQDGYLPTRATGTVEITGVNTKIIAPSNMTVMVKDLDNTRFNLTLLDAKGNKLANQVVSIEFNGAVADYVTDKNGAIHFPLSGAPAGTHVISMKYAGAGNYTASSASSTIVVVSTQKPAKVYLRNALYFTLQTKYVTVTLWDANNNPIAGKTVNILLNEYGLKYSGVTDENGEAHIRVGVGFGVHEATVSFDGDNQYSAANRSGFVRVIKETPSVMVRYVDTQFKVSDNPKTVNVYLKDRYDKPLLEGTKIVIKVDGQTFVGFTDASGVASINININKAGTFDAEVRYGGNTAYNAVTRSVKFVIK